MICLPLTERTLAQNLELLRRYQHVVDLAELRIDLLTPADRAHVRSVPDLFRQSGVDLPLIAVARKREDGGAWDGTADERISLLGDAAAGGFAHVDLELALRRSGSGRSLARRVAGTGCSTIRSYHDNAGQPPDPVALLRELASDGEIARLVVQPQNTRDVDMLLEAADRTAGLPKVIDATGPYAAPVRILSRRFGSLFTLADAAGAQGLGPRDLKELYRSHAINEHTRYFAVIGNPIAHSMSPEYHNRRFAADGINACYVPILVNDVDAFFSLAERLPLHGASVTIPHKETVLAHLAERDPAVQVIGSCNTLVRRPQGGWFGVNTDVPGFTAPLMEQFTAGARAGAAGNAEGWQAVTEGSPGATVIGAGGAARAVVYALLDAGFRVLVLNRTVERAQNLVEEEARVVTGKLVPETNRSGYEDVVVQTTSLGMHGDGDPAPWLEFAGSEIVYDIVYTPPDTPIIRRAREAGCRTVTGDLMFNAQADAQYRLFSASCSV